MIVFTEQCTHSIVSRSLISARYFVSSGTITINEDSSVQVLAEQAVPVDRLDGNLVREGLQNAQQKLSSAGSDEAKMEAQILVEVHEAMQRAVTN